jgi:hypothetical protein
VKTSYADLKGSMSILGPLFRSHCSYCTTSILLPMMSTLAKPLSHVLLSTRYTYQHTHVDPADLIEQYCWICLRMYFTQGEDDGDGSETRPECVPIKLPCGQVVGQDCFENYRRATNDVEQCLMCRQKLVPMAPRMRPAALLHRVCQTQWFQWHDRKLGWTPFGIEDVDASSSEVKMYNGQVLTWFDMIMIVAHYEATRVFLYVVFPIFTISCPVAVCCMAYQRFGNTSQSYVAMYDPALYDVYGTYSYSIWERFPEFKLLYDIATGHAIYDRAHHSSDAVPAVFFVFATIAFNRLTRKTHFPQSSRSMIVFLVYGRLVYAVLGYNILMVLGVLDMAAYLTVATSIVLIVNARARENNPSA